MARTRDELRAQLGVAIMRVLAAETGQFLSHADGWSSAPDVKGVRVRLLVEGEAVPEPAAAEPKAPQRRRPPAMAGAQTSETPRQMALPLPG